MFGKLKRQIEEYMLNECDDVIVNMMREKLKIDVTRKGNEITWEVTFSGKLVSKSVIDISAAK